MNPCIRTKPVTAGADTKHIPLHLLHLWQAWFFLCRDSTDFGRVRVCGKQGEPSHKIRHCDKPHKQQMSWGDKHHKQNKIIFWVCRIIGFVALHGFIAYWVCCITGFVALRGFVSLRGLSPIMKFVTYGVCRSLKNKPWAACTLCQRKLAS